MNDAASSLSEPGRRRPASTNGKLRGPKPPLRVGHVWSIRAKLQLERRVRDLALFNLAIDSKLRGCDLVALRVDDVAPNGYAIDRANVRQSKIGRPVRIELTEVTSRHGLDVGAGLARDNRAALRASQLLACQSARGLPPR